LKRIIKLKNGSEIHVDVDNPSPMTGTKIHDFNEFDIDWPDELEMAKKILMPKLNLKEHKIIILETPSMKQHGFFYEQWIKSLNNN